MISPKESLSEIIASSDDRGGAYLILPIVIIGNILFFVLLFYKPTVPAELYMILLAILTVIPPTIFGYTGRSFTRGVGVGTWPVFSLGFEIGNSGVPMEYILNMVQSGIFWGSFGLPVATILFGIGLFADKRHLHGEYTERYVRRALLTFTLTAIILIIRIATDILNTEVVH